MYKVYIRPLCFEDAQISYKWRNDPEVWKFTGSQPDREITHNIELDWIKKVIADDSGRRFAIIADDQYVGNIQLTNIKDRKAEYHIFIGDKIWWGKGISYLATYQILHFAKEELHLEEVFLSVREENIAAVKSYRNSSFAEDEMKEGWIKMTCKLELLPPPTVSVFVMVYNHEKFLHECLEGILMQQCNFPFNIVVGEDCSSDRSREILLDYEKKYPGKFKLLLHDKNIGAAANQNAVLAACEGKYIALCEGDDYWTDPMKLQKQVDFLQENEEYSLVYTDVHKVKSTNDIICRNFLSINEFKSLNSYDDFLLVAPFRAPCTWLFKAADIAGFDILHKSSVPLMDLSLLLLLSKEKKTFFLPEVTAHYRVLNNSASHFSSPIAQLEFNKKIRNIQLYFAENDLEKRMKIRVNFMRSNFRNILLYGNRNERAEMKQIIRSSPSSFTKQQRVLTYLFL